MRDDILPLLPLSALPGWYAFLLALVVAWGACIGSFLNACIYRIPNGLSVVRPHSFCPICRMQVAWYDNVPIWSWLALRGRCRCCRTAISPRYLLVEALVAALFLLVLLKYDVVAGARPLGLAAVTQGALVPAYWLMLSGLVLGTFVDFDHLIIPDRVTLGGIAAGLVLSACVPALHGAETGRGGLLWGVVGAAAGWGLLWAVAGLGRMAFRREAMGFGDVKLMGAIGAFLGWRAVLFTLVVSSLVGSAVGIGLVVFRRRGMQSRIPFGPYLALAAALWVFWGPRLLDLYLALLVCPRDLL